MLGGALEAAALLASALLVFRMGGDWIDTMVAALALMIGGPVVVVLGGWLGLRAGREGGAWRFGGARQVAASVLLVPAVLALEWGLWRTGAYRPPRPAADPFAGVSNDGVRQALADAEPTRRVLAAGELVTRGDPGAAQALAPLLSDPAPEVRASVAGLVGGLRGAGAFEALRPLLGDPDLGVRLSAANALGRCRDPRAVAALVPSLDDPLLGGAVADALAETGDARAASALLARLDRLAQRGGEAERQRVAAALRKLTGQELGTDPRAWRAFLDAQGASRPRTP